MSDKSDKWVSILLELDEMGITEQQIMKACRIKDRDTITGWYRGTSPRPKNRILLMRFFGQLKALQGQTEPTDEQVGKALANAPEGVLIAEKFDFKHYQHPRFDKKRFLWACEESKKLDGTSDHTMRFMEESDPKNEMPIFNDFDRRIFVVTQYHPDEFVRIYFNSI